MSNSTKPIESEPEHASQSRILTCAYCGASDESPLAAAYHVCDKAALENRISNQAARIAELEAELAEMREANGYGEYEVYAAKITALEREREEASARAAAMRAALERYADESAWEYEEWSDTEEDYTWQGSESPIEIAKVALAFNSGAALLTELATLRAQVGALKTENTVLFAQVEQLQDGTYVLEIERDNATLRAQAERDAAVMEALLSACKRALALVEDEHNNPIIVEMPGSFGLLLTLQDAIEKAEAEAVRARREAGETK